jgi:uncharacterized RDD family membrane protein YckC
MTDHPGPPPGSYPPPPPSAGGSAPPPPGHALPTEAYTPWLTRVLAYLIDSIPIIVVYGIAYVVQMVTMEKSCTETYGYSVCYSQPSTIGNLLMYVAYAAVLGYSIWNWGYKQGTTGQSIGKGVMKFKVVSEKTGQPIGFGMSVVRQIAHVADSFCLIGYLFPLWDSKRQTFADKIMTTVCLPA